MAINSSSIVSTLGAGSGVDIKALAESLVEAERKPLKDRLDTKLAASDARISGYGAMRSFLEQLKTSFEKLNESSDFGGLNLANSQPAAFTASLGTGAATGSYDISIAQLASAQRTRSVGLTSATADQNAGQALDINFTLPGESQPYKLTVGSATLEGIRNAILADTTLQAKGLSAEVVRFSSGGVTYHALEVQGQTGADQGFALAVDPASWRTDIADPADRPPVPLLQKDLLQEATDARVRVNGQSYTRTSNKLTDVIPNLTLELGATTTSTARLTVGRDVQPVKDNIKALVASYNDFHEALKVLADSKSDVETLGGSLAGDRLLQTVRTQMRTLIKGPDTRPDAINALRDLGISIDSTGRMNIDAEAKLDAALKNNFDATVAMFSSSANSRTGKGLAGDAIDAIDKLVSTKTWAKGLIQQQIDSETKVKQRYKDDLSTLEERMKKVLDRYMNQFSLMESMVGNATSLRTGLKSSFEGLMSAYK